jgi:hypothetical protein
MMRDAIKSQTSYSYIYDDCCYAYNMFVTRRSLLAQLTGVYSEELNVNESELERE